MELEHFSHQHPLLLNDDVLLEDDEDYTDCDLCWEIISSGTPRYTCKEDGCIYFCIHKSCADLPHHLQHPIHPKHDPLTLSYIEWTKEEEPSCAGCRRHQHLGYAYTCSRCNKFLLCIKCASLSLTTKVDIHDHPLTLMQKLSKFICDHCEKEGNGMFYFCATCSFMVHPECTRLPMVVQPLTKKAEIHNHSLTLARKLISFTCDACGKECRGKFYFCAICSFVFHLDCASLPLVVKVIRHEHPLNSCQSYSLPAISPSSYSVCQLCVNMVDTDYMFYHCSTCDFVAHLHCATSEEEKNEMFIWKSKDEDQSIGSSTRMIEQEELEIDESTDILAYVVKKFKLGLDGTEIAAEIKHFSHKHDLKLTDKLGINKKYDACTRHIFTPYYACAKCIFYLHKSCAELKRRMRCPLHRHPLMLLPRATYSGGTFGCDICGHSCNGFTYNCEECKFDLDVQCSLLPYKLTNDSHKHRLTFSRSQEGRKCNNCDSNAKILFCCTDCEFTLDFKCLTLPHIVWYDQHEHPFTLCYAPEDDLGEYYCDICEEERDPRFWFYYCADCFYPAHPECIHRKSPNLKFGKIYTSDFHQHPLTLVQKTKDHPLCEKCGNPCTDVAYECGKYNFNFHKWCL